MAIDDTTAEIVGGLGAVITLAWSQIQKWLTNRAHAKALAIAIQPGVHSVAQVDFAAKATAPGTIPTPVETAAILASPDAPPPPPLVAVPKPATAVKP